METAKVIVATRLALYRHESEEVIQARQGMVRAKAIMDNRGKAINLLNRIYDYFLGKEEERLQEAWATPEALAQLELEYHDLDVPL